MTMKEGEKMLKLAIAVALVILLPMPTGAAQDFEIADIIASIYQTMGQDITIEGKVTIKIEDEHSFSLSAYTWQLPGGIHVFEVIEPEAAKEFRFAGYGGYLHLLTDMPDLLQEEIFASSLILTFATDFLPTLIDLASLLEFDGGCSVTETEYHTREVFEILWPKTADEWEIRALVDKENPLLLQFAIQEDSEIEMAMSLRDVSYKDDGTLDSIKIFIQEDDVYGSTEGEIVLKNTSGYYLVHMMDFTSFGLDVSITYDDLKIADYPAHITELDEIDFFCGRKQFIKAIRLTDGKKWNEAIEVLESIVRKEPYHVIAHIQLGYVYMEIDDWMGARSSFEQALAIDPENALALNNYAYLLIDKGLNIEKGIEMAKKAVEIYPDIPAFLDTLAWGFFKVGEYEKAKDIMEEAMALESFVPDEKEAILFYHLACIYEALGEKELAQEMMEKAHKLDPENEKYEAGICFEL